MIMGACGCGKKAVVRHLLAAGASPAAIWRPHRSRGHGGRHLRKGTLMHEAPNAETTQSDAPAQQKVAECRINLVASIVYAE